MSRKPIHPFNEKLRERIFGFSSSRTEHENDVVSSPSRLSFLVQSFLETTEPEAEDHSASELDDDSASDLIRTVLNPILRSNADRFRSDLKAQITKAAEMFSVFKHNQTAFNRNIMSYLREIGNNSSLCVTNSTSYEFIDVVSSNSSRYIIDLNFCAQFEIARETDRYRVLLAALPRVFVGKSEDLKRIVRVMADEMRRSMKMSGMSLPPWRKNDYMQAKWFGPYRRSVNQVSNVGAVKCRSVGFFASAMDIDGGRLVIAPPTTRTR